MKNLLKIMFVDDEVNVLRGMRNSYDWDALGFTIVGEAGSAASALSLARQNQPDVVITDICMDGKDGLTLISELKEQNPATEVIILSGYPDFGYAKSAIEKGAFAYLLKPLKNAEFFETLARVRAKILEEHSQTASLFLSQLLQLSLYTQEGISSLEAEYGIRLPSGSFFLSVIRPEQPDPSVGRESCKKLLAFLRKNYTAPSRLLLCRKGGEHPHITALIFCGSVPVQTTLCAQLEEVGKNFSSQTGLSLSIGVSSLFKEITSIRDAYLEASWALQQKTVRPDDQLFFFRSSSGESSGHAGQPSTMLSPAEQKQLLAGIRTLNRPLTEQILNQYFSRLNSTKSINWDMLKNSLAELAVQILSTACATPEMAKLIFGRKPLPAVEILSMTQLSEMQEYIRRLTGRNASRHSGFRTVEFADNGV